MVKQPRYEIPSSFPAVQMDSRINCLRSGCDLQIHLVLHFDTRLDEPRLQRAMRLTLDAEPILGCNLCEESGRQLWRRRDDLDRLELLQLQPTTSARCQQQVCHYLARPLDLDHDPLLQGLLLRGETDTLCLKVSHIVADGGALAEYAALLASIYRQLAQQPDYQPQPNVAGDRSVHQVTRQFTLRRRCLHYMHLLRSYVGELFPRRNWSFPVHRAEENGEVAYVLHRLDCAVVERVADFARSHQLTANDLYVAACYRALYRLIQPAPDVPLRLGTTVNLRRYLPAKRGAALCNLSAMLQLNIGCELGENLLDTGRKVQRAMARHRRFDLGMGDMRYRLFDLTWLPIGWVRRLYRWHQMAKFFIGPQQVAPLFSNAGVLDISRFNFGENSVVEAYVTPPATKAPVFFVALSGGGMRWYLSQGYSHRNFQRAR